MKKLGILIIALALLVVGLAMAEPGIPQVREVQGLTTSTTVIAAGNFNAASSVQITNIHGDDSLADIPPLDNSVYYTSLYTEDTQNSEVGYVSYDKDLMYRPQTRYVASTTSRQSSRSPTSVLTLPQ